ncbi:MAG: plasmid mobilization relaxosome protein MobC [Sphingobacteriales bacterium]|nr:MAG: plasmid mobilization relaxosome protein MobC [Sphingobacteriales bacterium]
MMKQHKQDGDKYRTVTVRVRVKISEKLQLQSNAKNAGLTVSDWLRLKALNAKPFLSKPKPQQELLLKLLAELGKQGSNLNQLARHYNRTQTEDESLPLNMVMHVLETAKAVMNKLKVVLEQ